MKMGTDLFINNHEKWHFRKFLPLFLWRNKKLWQHVKWLIKGSDLHSFYIFPLHTLIKNVTFHFDKLECIYVLTLSEQKCNCTLWKNSKPKGGKILAIWPGNIPAAAFHFHFLFIATKQMALNFRSEKSLKEFIRKIFLRPCLWLHPESTDFVFKFLTACTEFLLWDFSLDFQYTSSGMGCKWPEFLQRTHCNSPFS